MSDETDALSLDVLRRAPLAGKLRTLLALLVADVRADESTVWLVDGERDLMVAALNHGPSQASVESQVVPSLDSVVGFVALCAVPIAIGEQDYQHPAVMLATGTRVTAMLAVPIRVFDAVIGTLSVVNPRERERFGSAELLVATEYAREIAVMLELATDTTDG